MFLTLSSSRSVTPFLLEDDWKPCLIHQPEGSSHRNLYNTTKYTLKISIRGTEPLGMEAAVVNTHFQCSSNANANDDSQLKNPVKEILDVIIDILIMQSNWYGQVLSRLEAFQMNAKLDILAQINLEQNKSQKNET